MMAEKKPEEKEKNKKVAKSKKKDKGYWRSKAMKRAYLVFGIPTFFLLL